MQSEILAATSVENTMKVMSLVIGGCFDKVLPQACYSENPYINRIIRIQQDGWEKNQKTSKSGPKW